MQARVLEYASLPRSIPFAQDNSILVGASGSPLQPLGRVPRVAICEESNGKLVLLFCDSGWRSLASVGQTSLRHAKSRVEMLYPGSSKRWVRAKVTKARASGYLERVWAGHRCLFCLKLPFEHNESVFHQGRGRICGACVVEFAREMSETS
jgi:hypothetical protein